MTNNQYRDIIADQVLLPGESKASLFFHMDQFEETFRPRTPLEQFLTGEMATNFFRQMRASCLERMIFQQLMDQETEMFPDRGLGDHVISACKSLALSPNAIDMVGRWHVRYHKLLRSNIRLFSEVRKQLNAHRDWEQSPPDPRASIYTAPLPNKPVAPEENPETTPDSNNGAPELC
jgi:hypothetical protein